jgi:hypothetical protein
MMQLIVSFIAAASISLGLRVVVKADGNPQHSSVVAWLVSSNESEERRLEDVIHSHNKGNLKCPY